MSRRLTLQEGFERLLSHYAPGVACERLEHAFHRNTPDAPRLYCDGNLLSPGYIKDQLRLIIEPDAAGRWQCRVTPTRLGFARTDYVWEVDAEGIAALLPLAPKRRGRKAVQNWTEIVDLELLSLRRNGSP